jgi:hypothetical protein
MDDWLVSTSASCMIFAAGCKSCRNEAARIRRTSTRTTKKQKRGAVPALLCNEAAGLFVLFDAHFAVSDDSFCRVVGPSSWLLTRSTVLTIEQHDADYLCDVPTFLVLSLDVMNNAHSEFEFVVARAW